MDVCERMIEPKAMAWSLLSAQRPSSYTKPPVDFCQSKHLDTKGKPSGSVITVFCSSRT